MIQQKTAPARENNEDEMKITIINDKTGKTINRSVEISELIDNNGNRFSQAVFNGGIARLRRDEFGEKEWYLV